MTTEFKQMVGAALVGLCGGAAALFAALYLGLLSRPNLPPSASPSLPVLRPGKCCCSPLCPCPCRGRGDLGDLPTGDQAK